MKISNFLIAFLLLLFIFHFSFSTIFALEPATASASLLEKLNTLKKEIASKAASLKLDLNKKLTNKLMTGQITGLDENRITINTKNGTKTATTNEYTLYQNNIVSKKGVRKSKISLKDFAVDDYILVLGDVDDKQALIAKKIIKSTLPEKNTLMIVWGKVISVTPSSITLKNKTGEQTNIGLNNQTALRRDADEITMADISINNLLVALGATNEGVLRARLIYQIPPNTMKAGKEKSATPSASPKTKGN
ncbi:hypothetical protein HYW46_00245 [Candidatus Daviesbacteria bacterium]|nr:hypothetical protein [Candidatus Daviesbacteria bacterium]